MARKTSRPSRGPVSSSPPPASSREVTIKPIHVLVTALVVILVAAGLLVLTAYYEAPPQTASAPPPANNPNIQVQVGGGGVQQIAPGGEIQVQPGQVVYPSGANRPDSTPEGFPAEGAANAPVTILEFADFQCPYCRQFNEEVLPKVREKYIKTGKVRLIWRDMSIRGSESDAAGAAALCAHEQGRFWPYHDLLYARSSGLNEGAFSPANLKAFAAEVGQIQPELFGQCLDTGRYLPAVKASTQDAQNSLKLTGTPTFYINGQKVEGNIGWEKWDELLTVATGS